MKRTRNLAIAAACLTLALWGKNARAQVSAAGQFDPANNPTLTGWSYGYETTLGGPFTLFTTPINVGSGIDAWQNGVDPFTGVYHNGTGSMQSYFTMDLQPGQMALIPDAFGAFTIVRWTVPTTGLFNVASTFANVDTLVGATSDVHVLSNGVSVFDGAIDATATGNGLGDFTSYNGTLNLNAGDTLDFVVGYGSNGAYDFDNVGLNATIATVPEASSLWLLLGGAAPLALLGRNLQRRRQKPTL